MPSPFPGMDPYLESPEYFPCLHSLLNTYIVEALQPKLPEPYYAKTGQLVWLETSHRYVEPDVEVLGRGRAPHPRDEGGVVATLAPAEPVVVTVEAVEDEPVEETFVEIYTRRGAEKRLVTSIEVLSLSNKTSCSPGRDKYLSKQREILAGQVHLVEIDLLRGGQHATAVPRDLALAKAGPFDYHVCTHRFDRPDDYLVHPIRLEQRLPAIAIPLLPGDPDVTLDLQAVFDRAYDAGPFRREVRRDRDPILPPLRPDQADWAAARLAAAR